MKSKTLLDYKFIPVRIRRLSMRRKSSLPSSASEPKKGTLSFISVWRYNETPMGILHLVTTYCFNWYLDLSLLSCSLPIPVRYLTFSLPTRSLHIHVRYLSFSVPVFFCKPSLDNIRHKIFFFILFICASVQCINQKYYIYL